MHYSVRPMHEPFSLPCGYTLHLFHQINSTMDHAYRLAVGGAPEGTVVLARMQTKGRGQLGKTWVSGLGNLHISILFKPPFPLQESLFLSRVLARSLLETLQHYITPKWIVTFKKPNDILVKGKKIGGILVESECESGACMPKWMVGGIGVNLVHAPLVDQSTICLEEAATSCPSLPEFFNLFLHHTDYFLKKWYQSGVSEIL